MMKDCNGIEYTKMPLGRAEDLTSKHFTKLTPLYRVKVNKNNKYTYWLCQCECGNQVVVTAINLNRGHTQSCGCLRKEYVNNQLKYESGDIINGFTFLGRDLSRQTSSGSYYWFVKCPYCQKEYSVAPEAIRNERINSCGCLNLSHGELQIKQLLEAQGLSFKQQVAFSDLVSPRGGNLRFDFGVYDPDGSLTYLIEYDGEQHFKPKDKFGGEDGLQVLQSNDELKTQYCIKHGIGLIRIPYTVQKIQVKDVIPAHLLYKVKIGGAIIYG